MRNTLVVGLVILAVTAVPAQAAKARWLGYFIIKKATGTCPDYNPVGTRGEVAFEPELSGTDNGAGSSITLFDKQYAMAYRLKDGFGLFTDAFKTVDTMYSGFDFGPDNSATVKMRFTKQKPGALKKTTNFITITAEIQNFNYMPGCTVSADIALTKRLE